MISVECGSGQGLLRAGEGCYLCGWV